MKLRARAPMYEQPSTISDHLVQVPRVRVPCPRERVPSDLPYNPLSEDTLSSINPLSDASALALVSPHCHIGLGKSKSIFVFRREILIKQGTDFTQGTA